MVDLSPARWPRAEREEWLRLSGEIRPNNAVAEGRDGVISGAYGAFATRAALEALKQGGSSVDAALAGSLAQIVLMAGAPVSFFGIFGMVHYDAASGETHTLNAGWHTCADEHEPLTIPAAAPSGRSALVGGFMRGFDAAHKRFGKLPYASLFQPAHWLAQEGFRFSKQLQALFNMRRDDLARLPATRAVFTKPDGSWYQEGDHFRQPALAATLQRLAEQGSDYFYLGEWAEKCVSAVRADGGRMSTGDLASCAPIWSPPIIARVAGAELALLGEPCIGSAALVEALLLAEAAAIPRLGHWSSNPESFRRLVDVTNLLGLMFAPAEMAARLYPGIDRSTAGRLRAETAQQLWRAIEQGTQVMPPLRRGTHSDNIVVCDRRGNMTTICQSINCVVWGKTAIMVDGVSIGDPAAAQQSLVAAAGAGKPLPMPLEIGLLERGRRRLAFASMNAGTHHKSVSCLLNLLHFGMTPKQAVDAPALLLPEVLPDLRSRVQVAEGEFDARLLEQTGLDIRVMPRPQANAAVGIWIAVERDAGTGLASAVAPNHTNGAALAC